MITWFDNYDFLIGADDLAPPTVEEDHINNKPVDSLTEEEKVALLGRPRLGEVTRAQIRIKESKEFKVFFFLHFPNFSY